MAQSVNSKKKTASARSGNGRRSDCPIAFGLDIFGDRWSLLVLRDLLLHGKRSFGEMLQSEEGIATNILTDRLTRLEAAGLIVRRSVPENRVKREYLATRKGRDLLPVLLEIASWSARYDPDTGAPPQFIARIRRDRDAVIRDILRNLPEI
jgi:DNA-binding HxlR family transcriptional regulator